MPLSAPGMPLQGRSHPQLRATGLNSQAANLGGWRFFDAAGQGNDPDEHQENDGKENAQDEPVVELGPSGRGALNDDICR